jgi:hypothetical protein
MSNPWKPFSKFWWHHTEPTEFIPGWGGGGPSMSPLAVLIVFGGTLTCLGLLIAIWVCG